MADEKRPYRMKQRAELEEPRAERITESAVALHGTVGPARTLVERAGRACGRAAGLTVYRHFPDEGPLFTACTGALGGREICARVGDWAGDRDSDARLRAALAAPDPDDRRTARMIET